MVVRSKLLTMLGFGGLLLGGAMLASLGAAGPPTPRPCPVPRLAEGIDYLEKQMARYGCVIAKAPDVWGQARLTLHRDEFERQMVQQLNAFTPTITGEVAASDQAAFTESLFLGAAIKSATAPTTPTAPSGTTVVTVPTSVASASGNLEIPSTGLLNRTNQLQSLQSVFVPKSQDLVLQIEPEELLDQRKRFLNHLHQIRRINEGDDTADSPGYSLNLVRIPVSILPGDKTRIGYGAEITVTAEPYVTEELLPQTFRDLVINDLVDQLSLPLLKLVEICQQQFEAKQHGQPCSEFVDTMKAHGKQYVRVRPSVSRGRHARYAVPPAQFWEVFGSEELAVLGQALYDARDRKRCDAVMQLQEVQSLLAEDLRGAYDLLANVHHEQAMIHVSEGQICQAPLDAFRNSTAMELGKTIRDNDIPKVCEIREAFRQSLRSLRNLTSNAHCCTNPKVDSIEALAWAAVVESALLNLQLNDDFQHVSQDPNCGCTAQPGELIFYGPNPSQLAKQAFVQYVKCRWPIHVFALDPDIQEQNVADTFSLRREMQLAFALAVSSGNINAQNLTQFMRRIEIDMRTIDLNRTIVGFGHGDDTFGWRFYPRFQTMDIEGNATVFFRDFLIGGPNRDDILRTHRIEPGMRECVAIVMMPSFIHHVRFDTRGNWFELAPCSTALCSTRLTRRGDTGTKMGDALDWSHKLRILENSANCCMHEEHCYREGEVERLLKRVKQLEARLPMQTMYSKVPNDNTIGGFQMFSSGVTDLAPELIGYYGAPGVDPSRDTTLFLVGNHFSIHGTRVVAGNMDVVAPELLSRQVIKVTIPAGTRTETRHRKPLKANEYSKLCAGTNETSPRSASPPSFAGPSPAPGLGIESAAPSRPGQVPPASKPCPETETKPAVTPPTCPQPDCCEKDRDPECEEVCVVNLATPYGVTSDLDIPVKRGPATEVILDWNPDSTPVLYRYTAATATGPFTVNPGDIYVQEPRSLEIRVVSGIIPPPTVSVALSFRGLNTGLVSTQTLPGIALDARRNTYVIDAANFQTLHQNLSTAVLTSLTATDPKNPPASFVVEVDATVQAPSYPTIPLKNKLTIPIKFAKK